MSKPLITWPLKPGRTAVVVVDMQKVFCEPDGALYVPGTAGVIRPIAALLECARAAAVPVIYLRHVVRGDGTDTGRMRDLYPNVDQILARDDPGIEIIEALRPVAGDVVVDKLFYSGFHNTDLDTVLRARDIDTLIVCGTVTNVCCDTTIRDAVHREYKVIALSDERGWLWPVPANEVSGLNRMLGSGVNQASLADTAQWPNGFEAPS